MKNLSKVWQRLAGRQEQSVWLPGQGPGSTRQEQPPCLPCDSAAWEQQAREQGTEPQEAKAVSKH